MLCRAKEPSPLPPSLSTGRGSKAFTLIELLVVIGIIAILASLLLVAINKLSGQGSRIKSSADLQAIATALEAYKGDFGSYPRVTTDNTGAAVLTKALMGVSPKPKTAGPFLRGEIYRQAPSAGNLPPAYIALVDITGNPSTTNLIDAWARFEPRDGADGQFIPANNDYEYGEIGFRVGPKTIDDIGNDGVPDRPGGKIHGPYVTPERFKVAKGTGFMLDSNGNPILYFPAAATKPNIAQAPKFVSGSTNTASPGEQDQTALFNANNNLRFFMRPTGATLEPTPEDRALKRVRAMLGDYGLDGALNKQTGMESETTSADSLSYLLWSAGPDGVFGPEVEAKQGIKAFMNLNPTDAAGWKANQKAVEACDDIGNFR